MEEALQRTLNWVYRQSPEMLTMYSVYAALIFHTFFRRFEGTRWLRPCLWTALGGWFGIVLCTTIFCRTLGGSYDAQWIPLHSYRYFFHAEFPEAFRSVFMNVLLFYPAGLLWAALFRGNKSRRDRIRHMVLLFGLFSLSIELSQYFFQLGTAEIDDVLHNTLGAAAGFAAFHLDLDDPHR